MHDELRPLMSDFRDGVRGLMLSRGIDPDSVDDLIETPQRAWNAMRELTQGYDVDVAAVLRRTFHVEHESMVVVKGIDFVSLCEHHLLPFIGTAMVGYVPSERVVGLSKIPRVVLAFAQRFQVQERMTDEIAGAIDTHLAPHGVGVVVEASHQCMSCRGVRQANARMVTTALLGSMRTSAEQRAEFLAHARA